MPTTAIMMARPIWVPTTLARPARVPWRMLVAMISVIVGPGSNAMNRQAIR